LTTALVWQQDCKEYTIATLILTVPCADFPQQSCHCCTTAEPSEEEFTAAKGEALQGLQVAIDNINDVLEELKYAEAEYDE